MADHITSTSWTESLRRGVQPSAADLRAHLITVHRAKAGFTEACAANCRDDAGRTSYEWLADTVDPGSHHHVLDLACGSGPLLSLLAARHKGRVQLTGVDMSGDELAVARSRLPDGAASLQAGLAQDMPFLPHGGVAAVLCHWALTLMDPVEPVLREVHRVLRPGGVFAAIIDGPMALAPHYETVNDIIYSEVQRDVPAYGTFDMGDPRVRSADALEDLAGGVFGADRIQIEPNVVTLTGPAMAVAREAAGFFYASFLVPDQARQRMLDAIARVLSVGDGKAAFHMPINRLCATR